jgi:2-polyprenyl-3-methyl-5-hydroxy-6-metoxy-1,4-benzoquinol methylase
MGVQCLPFSKSKMTRPSLIVRLQVELMRRIAPPVPLPLQTLYDEKSKLAMLLGNDFLQSLRGLVVLDFGCGYGLETIEMAKAGARLAIGLEIEEELLAAARRNAEQAGVGDRCQFVSQAQGPVDRVISLDCFEHYADPAQVLRTLFELLRPGGSLHVSFGPPWYHPKGMHLNELPPWTHVFCGEEAVLRWRQLMRGGNALTYAEVGLNRMTVARFVRLIRASHFEIELLRVMPIQPLRWVHNRLTREFTTSVVQCALRKPAK